METAVPTKMPAAPNYSDAPQDEATMRAQIQEMFAEMDAIREKMREDEIVIEREKARTRVILDELRKA